MKALSIVVVNWNAEAALAKCLEFVERTVDFNEVEVIVVDNCSSDDSVAMVQERFAWVRLIDNRENVGFAQANNQGIEISRGKHVMLLNPDTELSLGAVNWLVEASAAHPNVERSAQNSSVLTGQCSYRVRPSRRSFASSGGCSCWIDGFPSLSMT